jgi:hypothetical protein
MSGAVSIRVNEHRAREDGRSCAAAKLRPIPAHGRTDILSRVRRAKDTTIGPEWPLNFRGASMADIVGEARA